MTYTVKAGARSGSVLIPASKSCAHRQLICAALSQTESTLRCDGLSKDIAASIHCLTALGAQITQKTDGLWHITPIKERSTEQVHLFCGESGSTLRFLLPLVGALGQRAVFHREGKLPQRPLGALAEVLTAHGMTLRQDGALLYCEGTLSAGCYEIAGDVSSQYISGLLFALPLLAQSSTLHITGAVESAQYIALTEAALQNNGIHFEKSGNTYEIPGKQHYFSPQHTEVERDWSNAAFFLCMGALSEQGMTLTDMPMESQQGDREILEILRRFGAEVTVCKNQITVRRGRLRGQVVDASHIPDLVPTVSALAAGAEGVTEIINAGRLRMKESDRLESTTQMLLALGAQVEQTQDGLKIFGKPQLQGGTVEPCNDHRIAMAAAVAAGLCKHSVQVLDAKCVEKSYPDFWRTLETLEVSQ